MILVDTSVWVGHLRVSEATLAALLEAGQVLVHPFVIGELALGNLRQRASVLALLQDLPAAVVATDQEVMQFIERHSLGGPGIGYVDAHLLASVRLTAGSSIWTLDRRLAAVATRQGMATTLPPAGIRGIGSSAPIKLGSRFLYIARADQAVWHWRWPCRGFEPHRGACVRRRVN